MKIAVFGDQCPLHVTTIQKALGPNSVEPALADWAFFIYPQPRNRNDMRRLKYQGLKTCAYWVGNDARWLMAKRFKPEDLGEYDLHLCVHERTQKDLKRFGIDAKVLYFMAREIPRQEPDIKGRVAIYMPSTTGKYQFERCKNIARRCSKRDFVFYGNDDIISLPQNCEGVGRLTPEESTKLIAQSAILLRLSDQDGFPQNIIEAMMLGKRVICNYPYQGVFYSDDDDEIVDTINGEPYLHWWDDVKIEKWKQWYKGTCSPEAWAWNLQQRLADFENPNRFDGTVSIIDLGVRVVDGS